MKMEKQYNVSFLGWLKDQRQGYWKELKFSNFNDKYSFEHTKIVAQSKINLGFTTNNEGTSDRTYKILAAGGFLLTEPWKYMENDWEVGKDFVCFSSISDLKDKIGYYLKNQKERHEIAEQGRKKVQRFSTDNWAKSVLERTA
jgi:spore maturation protein CgeB